MHRLFRDLSLGKPFPICQMSGSGNSGTNDWAVAPEFCPPQYTRSLYGESGPTYACDYVACVSVTIDGGLFSQTWWNFDGDSVTGFSARAKETLGTWDPKFDDDYARWLGVLVPAQDDPQVGR